MYNYMIKTSFVSPEMPKARANILVLILWLFIFIFVGKLEKYDTIHEFSVWIRTDSNPADINRFRSLENVFLIWSGSASYPCYILT